jgi:hypothetical protein
MKKKIGITCDDYKTDKFRKGLLKEGLTLEFDGKSGIDGVHLFRIEVEQNDFPDMMQRIGKITRRLEIEFKQSN